MSAAMYMGRTWDDSNDGEGSPPGGDVDPVELFAVNGQALYDTVMHMRAEGAGQCPSQSPPVVRSAIAIMVAAGSEGSQRREGIQRADDQEADQTITGRPDQELTAG